MKITIKILLLVVLFLLNPLLGHAQDCCGPGGSGGGTQIFSSASISDNYRLKGVRHYAYSARHPGFTVGLESANFTDSSELAFTPRVEYYTSLQASEKSSFDIYGAFFYTVFAEAPHSHQIDLSGNIGWRYTLTENSRFVLRIDTENVFVFYPKESGIKYTGIDPSVGYIHAFNFGDISFYAGLPMYNESLSSWACIGYEHPIGFGISICPRFTLLPDASYAGITLNLTFNWDKFHAKAAFVFNEDFTAFQVRPYLEYTLNNLVFWGGVNLGIPKDGNISASPFIGVGYNF